MDILYETQETLAIKLATKIDQFIGNEKIKTKLNSIQNDLDIFFSVKLRK